MQHAAYKCIPHIYLDKIKFFNQRMQPCLLAATATATTSARHAWSACSAFNTHTARLHTPISQVQRNGAGQPVLPLVVCRFAVDSCSVASSSDLPADLVVLQQVVRTQQLEELLSRHPEVLTSHPSPLASWVEFLRQYGLTVGDISKLLLICPELFVTSSIYESGRTLLFFKQLGWQDADICSRIVPYYPNLLAKQLERDICPVLAHLSSLGCSSKDIRLLVWEFPRIFNKDYRRHIRKFQYLGLYGLPPIGSQLKPQPLQEHQQRQAETKAKPEAEAGISNVISALHACSS